MKLNSDSHKEYNVSQGEWVDDIPTEWQEKRVKDLFKMVTDMAPNNNDLELLSLYASIGVRPRKDLEARGNKASSTDGYWMVKKGDIVVNKLLAWMGAVGLSEYDGVTSPAYDVLRKIQSIDARYFGYLFRTDIAKRIFKKNSRGIMDMRLRLYFDKLGAITVPVPPLKNQQAIASYIDTKTTQIDQEITLLSQKAEQYGKLKQSLINETVTRGLDKTVAMKESGVEWIGEIPEHWNIMRLKQYISFKKGKTPNVLSDDSSYLPYLSMDFLRGRNKPVNYVMPQNGLVLVSKADHLVLWDGANAGEMMQAKMGYLSSTMALISINNKLFNNTFFFYFLKSMEKKLKNFSNGTTIPHFAPSELTDKAYAFPPILEQKNIANYLDKKTALIDTTVKTINTKITKLKELRKTLINDVVTGKIKVSHT